MDVTAGSASAESSGGGPSTLPPPSPERDQQVRFALYYLKAQGVTLDRMNQGSGIEKEKLVHFMTRMSCRLSEPTFAAIHSFLQSLGVEIPEMPAGWTPEVQANQILIGVAVRDYSARSPEELSFSTGDRLVITLRDDANGWHMGQHNATGVQGLIPADCVEITTIAQTDSSRVLRRPPSLAAFATGMQDVQDPASPFPMVSNPVHQTRTPAITPKASTRTAQITSSRPRVSINTESSDDEDVPETASLLRPQEPTYTVVPPRQQVFRTVIKDDLTFLNIPKKNFVENIDAIENSRYDLSRLRVKPGQTIEYGSFKRAKPYFTYLLILICTGMFIWTMIVAGGFAKPKLNPMLGPDAEYLITVGGNLHVRTVLHHEWWRWFTAPILHAGVVHIVANMFVWYKVGVHLEPEWGFIRVFFLFIFCGWGGSLSSTLFTPLKLQIVSVGASGAIMGFYGAMSTDMILNWRVMRKQRTQVWWLYSYIIIFLLFGLLPFADNICHFGGLFTGMVAGFSFSPHMVRPGAIGYRRWAYGARVFFGFIALCAMLGSAAYTAFHYPTFECHLCCEMMGQLTWC